MLIALDALQHSSGLVRARHGAPLLRPSPRRKRAVHTARRASAPVAHPPPPTPFHRPQVRTAAQQWLVDASGAPDSLLRPLLTLLLSPAAKQRVRLYALAKLRAALACMPAGTLSLLAQQAAPAVLVALCGEALDAAATRGGAVSARRALLESSVLTRPSAASGTKPAAAKDASHGVDAPGAVPEGGAGCPLLQLLAASALVVILHQPLILHHDPDEVAAPASGRAAQVLAAELLTALLHAVPPPLGEALATALVEPLLLCLQASVGCEAPGVQQPLLALAAAALTLDAARAAPGAVEPLAQGTMLGHQRQSTATSGAPWQSVSELLVQTTMLGISCR